MSHKIYNHNNQENLSDHQFAVITGLKQIFLMPIISFVFILIMTFAIAAATTFYILLQNATALSDKWNESAEISLYLKKNTSFKEATDLITKIRSNSLASNATLITPTEGMKYFVENTTLSSILTNFKENPLPNVIIIHPKVKLFAENTTASFIQTLKNYPEVDSVKADSNWINRSHDLLILWDNLSIIFILALGLNALFVIGGGSYAVTRIFTTKKPPISKTILQYKCGWLGFISGIFALLLVRLIEISMQNHGVILPGIAANQGILIILSSTFVGMITSIIATINRSTHSN